MIWEWKENSSKWIPYSKEICGVIEQMELKEDHQYTATNDVTYIITKSAKDRGLQTNKNTNYQREIRRTERENNGWMQLFGANMDFPEYWDRSFAEYTKPTLCSLPRNGSCFQFVSQLFFKTVSLNQYEIVEIEGVQNQMLYEKYMNVRQTVIKELGSNYVNEQFLFHGTKSEDTMQFIETEGFRKEFNSKVESVCVCA